MIVRYEYNGFEGGMTDAPCGDFVSVGDYFDLKEQHDAFLKDVRRVLDDLLNDPTEGEDFHPYSTITNAADNLEAAFRAEENPQDAR